MAYIVAIVAITSINWGAFHLQPIATSKPTSPDAISREHVVALTNTDREKHGLSDLKVSVYLEILAEGKAYDLASHDSFSHLDSGGMMIWDEADRGIYPFTHLGENLAYTYTSAQEEEAAWMTSPEHRANVLDASYKDIGVAVVNGTHEGKPTKWVVVIFGSKT